MNELFNVTTPFDPLFAQIAMYLGALLLNLGGVSLFTAALIHFVLKPGTTKISARRCFIGGIICILLGLLCLIPQIANAQSMTEAFKNIRP